MTKPKPPDIEALVRMAAAQATVILPALDLGEDWGTHMQYVNLLRLDGEGLSDDLLEAVKAAGGAAVAEALRKLGASYFRTVERIAAEHVGEERAWRLAARAWALGGLSPKRLFVLPRSSVDEPEPVE